MTMNNIFPEEILEKLQVWEKKFPSDRKRSVILPGLHLLQDYNGGYLTDHIMHSLASYLSLPPLYVYEVATFYSMFNLKPVGKHQINICTNISCMLKGSEDILQFVEDKLGITAGNTTDDSLFTLNTVECQGICCNAPVMEIDKIFYKDITCEKMDKIIDSLE